jgi:hypothetical protein
VSKINEVDNNDDDAASDDDKRTATTPAQKHKYVDHYYSNLSDRLTLSVPGDLNFKIHRVWSF